MLIVLSEMSLAIINIMKGQEGPPEVDTGLRRMFAALASGRVLFQRVCPIVESASGGQPLHTTILSHELVPEVLLGGVPDLRPA